MYVPSSQLQMSDSDDVISSSTQERIQSLVDDNPVLLFMKGSKLFPQCGFSNTACQILQSYNIDFESVDVLADEDIRQGVKIFSQWPTIPQLYVCGEFVGGSDIMIEMYQSGWVYICLYICYMKEDEINYEKMIGLLLLVLFFPV